MNIDLQQLISTTLRVGVSTACAIAALAGLCYLYQHGADPLPDYSHFSYATAQQQIDYTTLSGIFGGLCYGNTRSWIQLGVLVLLLTPITRVVLSLFDFVKQRDWLYATITAIVLSIIIANSIEGF